MTKTFQSMARRGVIVVLVCYWLMLFVGTHLPSAPVVRARMNDKVLHFGAYCGLSLLLSCSFLRRPSWKGILSVLAIIAVYGVFDEWSQMLVPSRSAELADWLADISGGLVGLALFYLIKASPRAEFARGRSRAVVRRDAA